MAEIDFDFTLGGETNLLMGYSSCIGRAMFQGVVTGGCIYDVGIRHNHNMLVACTVLINYKICCGLKGVHTDLKNFFIDEKEAKKLFD